MRSLSETVRLDARTKLLNPKFYEGMLASGYEGTREITKRLRNTMGPKRRPLVLGRDEASPRRASNTTPRDARRGNASTHRLVRDGRRGRQLRV